MLWFKFILGLKFFNWFQFLFAIVQDYGNEYTTKENKHFAPKLNLNHNIYGRYNDCQFIILLSLC